MTTTPILADAESAVLLPVRLETRFDTPEDGTATRLRVLVIPDVCWFDRHQAASTAELELLTQAVDQAGGPLVTGAPSTPKAAAAFDALAAKVGPGRAFWLARHGADQASDARRDAPTGTRIHGLPPELVLSADVATVPGGLRRVLLGRRTVTRRSFTITPNRDDPDGWWPSWDALDAVGLAFDVPLEEEDQAPIDPDAIACLYVVGLGDVPAEELLRPHLATGDLGLAHQGTPTNTVAGSRAVDRHRDAGSWRRLGEGEPDPEARRVAQSLTSDPASLGRLVGASAGHAGDCAALLIPILWPALASVLLDDVWGAPPERLSDPQEVREHRARVAVQTGAVREWATSWLRPDGPLPILRIGDQPYGLWPVSDWASWQEDTQPIRESVVRIARAVLPTVADRAETGLGTVVEADAGRLWELLAQTPTANGYDARATLEMRWLRPMLEQRTIELFEHWWWRIVDALGGVLPADVLPAEGVGGHLLTAGVPVPVPLRLVLPDPAHDPRETLRPSLDVDEDEAISLLEGDPNQWLAAALRQFEDLFQESALNGDLWNLMGDPLAAWPPSLFWRLTVVSGLIALDHAVREANEDYPEHQPMLERIAGGIPSLHHGAAVEAYQRFREALGTLREFCESSGDPGLPVVLGRILAGFLDTATCRVDPWLTGAAWQRLHSVNAPRPVGLYGWVDRPHLGKPGPDLETGVLLAPSDAQARTAVVLRDKSRSDPEKRWHLDLTSERVRAAVRLGDEIRAGAHPAEAVGREVERLVGDRPRVDALRAKFRLRTEHAGRRTCDGLAVLDAARSTATDPRLTEAGLDQGDIERIGEFQTTLDAYADLLVADSVHHALAGRPEAAHQSMEAAAGLGMPPSLDVLATPRSGRAVHTTVLARFPAAHAVDGTRSPATIASPGFAAWLATETGAATGPGWTWQVQTGAEERAVSLADLGLEPADTLAIHAQILHALVVRTAGAAPGAVVVSPPGPEQARGLAATLPTRIPNSVDLGVAPDGALSIDGLVANELHDRLARLDTALEAVVTRLEAAATDEDRVAALVGAVRWGTLPTFEPDDLEARTEDILAELRDRRQLAATVDAATDVTELGRIIARVALGDSASLPMTVTLPTATLTTAVGALAGEPAEDDGRPRLDRTWLELVAAVRPPLARIEAHQARAVMAGRPPLSAATSHPGDPWLEAVPGPDPRDDDPRLMVAYGPDVPPGSDHVAMGLIDGWAEVIPLPEHAASAAFSFNAPGSRAPQALLLAVAPVPGEPLTASTIASIVGEARLAAHARMARREDLANLDLLTGGLLPAFEPGGFQWAVPANSRSWGQ